MQPLCKTILKSKNHIYSSNHVNKTKFSKSLGLFPKKNYSLIKPFLKSFQSIYMIVSILTAFIQKYFFNQIIFTQMINLICIKYDSERGNS